MTKIDQLKILDNKIRANKAQYDLDREAAKISALSSGELEKYEYLSGEDLGYKPDVVQKAKFEYSPLAKVFNKGLDEKDRKEGLLKRLKNIEDKNQLDETEYQVEKQIDAIKEQGKKNLTSIKKQEKKLKEIKNQKKKLVEKLEMEEKSEKIVLLKDNLDDIVTAYDMNITAKGKDVLKKVADHENGINYKNLFFKSGIPTISNYDFLKRFGTLYDFLIDLLNKKTSLKKAALEQAKMIDKKRELKDFLLLEEKNINKEKDKSAIKKAKTKMPARRTILTQKSVLTNATRLFDRRYDIIDAFADRNISPGDLEKDVYQEEESKYEKSIAERTKERRQDQQSAKGLKLLTPQQMLTRLPISLAQLKAGNNSEKLKNEIRQLLYSLYRSKKLSKIIYENLIKTI